MAVARARKLLAGAATLLAAAVVLIGINPAAAVADTPDGHLWAVDTADPITTDFINKVKNDGGDVPDVWGRYINFCTTGCANLNKTEIALAKSKNISLFFLSADPQNGKTGTSKGSSNASNTVSAAKALGIPTGALLIDDIESGTSLDSAYLQAWYKGVTGAGYRAGFYSGASNFSSAFCSAVSAVPAMKTSAAIDTPDAQSTKLGPSDAPKFSSTSDWPSCGGAKSIWQYSLGQFTGTNYDQDEIDPNLAGLLLPSGKISGGGGGGGGSPGYSLNGGWFEHTDSDWHGLVLGKDNGAYELTDQPNQQWRTGALGGQSKGTLSITHVAGTGRYDYWALSPAGNVWRRTFDNGALGPWQAAGIATSFDPKNGIVALYAGGTYKIFGVGTNGNVYYSVDNKGTWSTANLLGNVTGTLGVTYVNGRYDIFAISATNGGIYQLTGQNGTWGSWKMDAITTRVAPNTGLSALYAVGQYRVYLIGVEGGLHQEVQAADGSNSWRDEDLGGNSIGTPAAVYRDGVFDVFALSPSSNIWQDTWTSATRWQGWHLAVLGP